MKKVISVVLVMVLALVTAGTALAAEETKAAARPRDSDEMRRK